MNHDTRIQVGPVLARAWQAFRADWTDYIQVGAILWVALATVVSLWGPFAIAALAALLGPVVIGAVSTLLLRARTGQFDLQRMGDGFRMYPVALVASTLALVFHILGVVACIVGAVVVRGALLVYYPFVCDRKDAVSALDGCWKFFVKSPLELTLVALALLGINALGLLVCTLGLIATLPYSLLVSIVLYEEALRAQEPPAPAS